MEFDFYKEIKCDVKKGNKKAIKFQMIMSSE